MKMRVAVIAIAGVIAALTAGVAGAVPSNGRDKPGGIESIVRPLSLFRPFENAPEGGPGNTGGQLSKVQIERFRCESSGNPAEAVDMSCNTEDFGQDFAPDNEVAVAVNPEDPDHVVAGSNDYFYRFNNSTGARQAIVPTGFFTSFDGGQTWVDGQVPMRTGNGAGDPVPAFDVKNGVVMMAQLENTAGQGGPYVAQGDVTVSTSVDGGLTWSEPVMVMKGQGAGIGPANQAEFWDKEWLAVDNNPDSAFYGRAYLTATLFRNGLQGAYIDSPIYLSMSDDGGRTWTEPTEISGSNELECTYQETGPAGECDEDQFSIPAVASDGTVYVHFLNGQNEAEWEVSFDFDSQIMVVRSHDGGETWSDPLPAVQLEDGLSDMPYSVIFRQTVWGHQIRWTSAGNIAVNPNAPNEISIVFSDRGTPNPNASEGCFFSLPGVAPEYDPCAAGPGSDLDVYRVTSIDAGDTWSARQAIGDSDNHQWFPWSAYLSDGTLVAAWDEDMSAPPADTFQHVLWRESSGTTTPLGPAEHIDVSVTHWAGQYTTSWPAVCGPAGYTDPIGTEAPGKDCNVFHGDYTGLAVGSDDSVHVTWTGLNQLVTSPQLDFYTGDLHDGYRQDAMYARR
jgi:hypothetical protein